MQSEILGFLACSLLSWGDCQGSMRSWGFWPAVCYPGAAGLLSAIFPFIRSSEILPLGDRKTQAKPSEAS